MPNIAARARLALAILAIATLSVGTAFAGEGNGQFYQGSPNSLPPGFMDETLATQHREVLQNYRAEQAQHASTENTQPFG